MLRLLIALGIGLALAFWAQALPAPLPVDAPRERFSAMRARADVAWIAEAAHPLGTPEHERVRQRLMSRLRDLGLSVEVQHVDDVEYQLHRSLEMGHAALDNVFARVPGRDRTLPPLLLMSHYDSVPDSPGAADDGAAVAMMLELARILRVDPCARDVLMVFSDGEEGGLVGAEQFFAHEPVARQVSSVINFDARGGAGRVYLFELGAASEGALREFARARPTTSASSFAAFIYDHMPNGTDFTVPKDEGISGFNFAFISEPAQYHTRLATVDALSMGTLQELGDQALAAMRLLGAETPPAKSATRLVWSDLFGHFLVVYAAWWGWVLIAVAVVVVLATRRPDARSIGRAALFLVALLVAEGVLLYGCELLSGSLTTFEQIVRLWVRYERYELAVVLVALGVLVAVTKWVRTSWLDVLTLGVVVALVVQALSPRLSTLCTWPLLIAAVAAFAARWTSLVTMAAAAIVAGLAFEWGHEFYLGLGLFTPSVLAPIVVISSFGLFPLVAEVDGSRHSGKLAGLLVFAGYCVALSVRWF